MKYKQPSPPRRSAIALAITATIGGLTLPTTAFSDVYTWGVMTADSALTTTCAASPDALPVLFTMLDPTGAALANSSITAKGANQYRTSTCGTLSYDTATQSGNMSIGAFDFFAGTEPAVAAGITINRVPDGLDDGSGNLLLANMLFNWNGNNGIPVSISMDAGPLFNEMDGSPTTFTLTDEGGGVITVTPTGTSPLDAGESSTPPASDGTYTGAAFGYLLAGPVPLATTEWNTTNVGTCTLGGCMGISPSADITGSSAVDDLAANGTEYAMGDGVGIGGNPMQDGPFQSNNANFDFTSMTLTSFTDTTPPVVTLVGNATINVAEGDTYSDPGVSCTDAAPLNTAIPVTTAGDTVNTAVAANYTVTYNCADSSGNAATQVTRTVKVNAIPVANTNYDQALFSNETLAINFTTIDLTGSDFIATDANGDTLTFSSVDATTTNGGTVTGVGTGELTYTPATAYVGADSFTFTVNDGSVDSAAGTVNLDVKNVLPVAVNDTASGEVDQVIPITVVGNDSDYEDDLNSTPLTTLTIIASPSYGAITGNAGGVITYTAPASIPDGSIPGTVAGKDSFSYTVTDSNTGVSDVTTVTVSILAAPNAIPTTQNVSYNTDAGTPLNIDITLGDDSATIPAADTDSGDVLIFTSVAATSVNGGTITGNDSGVLTYTPAAGYNGPDSFTFTATDDKGGVSTPPATINITVNQVAPVAVDDTAPSMLLGDTQPIDVLANDTDVEDDATSTALTITPASLAGTDAADATIVAGKIDYTPTTVGPKTFTYTVTDSDGNESTAATVTVDVTAAPVSPLEVPKITNEDISFSINVADAATDADGDALTFDAFTQGTNGTVEPNIALDILTYTPNANFNGTDSFTYTVSDSSYNTSNTSTVNVTVTAVDDDMVCPTVGLTTAVDTPLQITSDNLIGGCTDVDGTVTLLAMDAYTQPTNGAMIDDGAGNLTYTPDLGFVGPDSFAFTASDGSGVAGSDTTYTASIAVVDDPSIHIITGGNFTMLDPSGNAIGGATDVSAVFDEKLICSDAACIDYAMTTPLASAQPFNSNLWTAHHIRVFGPGTYTIDTVEGDPLTFTVANEQLGAHMLFDWGTNSDIDVAVVWNYNTAFGDPIYDGDCAGGKTTCDATQTPTRLWNWASIDGDGNGKRGIAMVDGPFKGFHANFNLDMTAGYTPPLANDDNTSTTPGLLKTIDVLANDSDAEDGAPPSGATVTLLSGTSAQGGMLTNNGDGTVDYTPDLALIAGDTDSFQYTIIDVGGAVSNVATVTISITDTINTAPVAYDATSLSVDEDTTLTINVTNAAVASDAESDPLTFATFDAASANGGTVTINGTMTALIYTPQANFSGTDTFNFSVNDGLEDSNVATMTITVNPVNDAPVCVDVTMATGVDTPLVIDAADLVVGCTDIEGDTVTFASAEAPANTASTLVDDYAGTLTYTPESGLNGSDSFVFTATDGNGGNATATAEILVGKIYGNFTMLDKQGDVFGGTNDVVFIWDGVSMHSAETDLASNMTIVSDGPHPFFGAPWFAHHVRVFGPGTYTFEADNKLCQSKAASPDAANASTKTLHGTAYDIDVTGCPGTGTETTMSMTVADGQVGVHILFDYNGSFDIDVINVYDMNAAWNDSTGQGDKLNDLWVGAAGASPDPTTDWGLVSTDVNGDGVNGAPMVDGPFVGFYANFNDAPGGTAPPPAAITTTVRDTSVGGALSWLVLLGMLPLISLFRMRMK